jgi:hypothetical protein
MARFRLATNPAPAKKPIGRFALAIKGELSHV